MNRQNDRREIPDWKLERYLLGELPSEELEGIRMEAQQNRALRERLDALERSDLEIRDRYPTRWMARQIREKADMPIRTASVGAGRFPSRLWPMPALPALACLLIIAVVSSVFLIGDNGQEEWELAYATRLKGVRPHLQLFRKTDTEPERLRDGSAVRENDLIQIVYQAAGREYGVVLSVDGRGTTTLHLPDGGDRAARLQTGRPDTLNFAYELDDAPKWERFYFITANAPFEVKTVMDAARQRLSQGLHEKGDSLRVPDIFDQFIFTLKKGGRDE